MFHVHNGAYGPSSEVNRQFGVSTGAGTPQGAITLTTDATMSARRNNMAVCMHGNRTPFQC